MPRSFSVAFTKALMSQETGEVLVALLTINHPTLEEPIRISSDNGVVITEDPRTYGTISRSNTYWFMPFTLTLPDDSNEAPPTAQIVIDNIMREHIALIRSVASPPTVLLELVLGSSPDTVEVAFPVFDMSKVEYDSQSMTMTLVIDPLVTEPFPGPSFSPAEFPGLFA